MVIEFPLIIGDTSLEEALSKVNSRFMKGFRLGQIDVAVRVYTNNARLLPPNSSIVEGRDAIQNFWEAARSNLGIRKVDLKTKELIALGPKSMSEIGEYTLWNVSNQRIDEGKYVVVWLYESGWKWDIDIFNTSRPPS